MFLTILSYGQKSTLLQNKNFRAQELKHSLNKDCDSLLLKSDKTIYSVEIFNKDYNKTVIVDSTETKISLKDTPLGRLVVQARLIDKRIIMTLLRNEPYDEIPTDSIPAQEEEIADIPETKTNDRGVSSLLNWKSKKSENQKYYWVSYEINNGNSTSKSMKLVNGDDLSKMILKNKAETETTQGKLNKLTVWEVYDTAKFMEAQVANPDYIFSSSSTLFNTTPYFSTSGNARIP